MIVRLSPIIAQTARSFLLSVDQILPAATEAGEVDRLGLGQQYIFLLKWTTGVSEGVELKFEVKACRIRAQRVAES